MVLDGWRKNSAEEGENLVLVVVSIQPDQNLWTILPLYLEISAEGRKKSGIIRPCDPKISNKGP